MVCLEFEPGASGWKAQTNPPSYGGTPWPLYLIGCKYLLHICVGNVLAMIPYHVRSY